MTLSRNLCAVSLIVWTILVTAPAASGQPLDAADHWPQWRGPHRNGVSPARNLPLTWSETKNIAWKTPLPGWGGATPIVWGDRVFVTSPSKKPDAQADAAVGRRLPRAGRADPGGPRLLLLCFSRKDGKQLWQRELGDGNVLYGKQNMASPSAVTDGRHVWAVTGTGVVSAFDMDGKPVWRYELQKQHGDFGLYWGYASSPLLYDGKLIVEVLHGATTQNPSYVIAFDAAGGRVLWRVERKTDATRECPDAYTTPTVAKKGDRVEIIVSGANWVTAHNPSDGSELWRAGGLNPDDQGNYRIVNSPVAIGDLILAGSRVRPLLALRAGGSGDVTSTHVAWKYESKNGPDVPTPVCDGRHVYLVDDRGITTCLDAKTGNAVWGPQRTAVGTVSSSPVLADQKLYVTNEGATTTVLAAGPEFKVLATNQLDDEYTIASMAVAGSQIFVRSSGNLYCIAQK
ncbi:MAG: PQQ-like beta-propeller repeat protein [Phycisphaerae bacterium]|nr:PQQ-like beta-propeller repeat protein [Phycisphaerae bacterium]